jgi:hypothetical protein
MSSPLDPLRLPRIDPAAPLRRVERPRRDEQRDEGRGQPYERPDDGDEPDEDEGVHVDVLA